MYEDRLSKASWGTTAMTLKFPQLSVASIPIFMLETVEIIEKFGIGLGVVEEPDTRIVVYQQRKAFLIEAKETLTILKEILSMMDNNNELFNKPAYMDLSQQIWLLEDEIRINERYDKEQIKEIEDSFKKYCKDPYVDERPTNI